MKAGDANQHSKGGLMKESQARGKTGGSQALVGQ